MVDMMKDVVAPDPRPGCGSGFTIRRRKDRYDERRNQRLVHRYTAISWRRVEGFDRPQKIKDNAQGGYSPRRRGPRS